MTVVSMEEHSQVSRRRRGRCSLLSLLVVSSCSGGARAFLGSPSSFSLKNRGRVHPSSRIYHQEQQKQRRAINSEAELVGLGRFLSGSGSSTTFRKKSPLRMAEDDGGSTAAETETSLEDFKGEEKAAKLRAFASELRAQVYI